MNTHFIGAIPIITPNIEMNSNNPSDCDLITAQVLAVFVLIVIVAFGVGLAIGGFYF